MASDGFERTEDADSGHSRAHAADETGSSRSDEVGGPGRDQLGRYRLGRPLGRGAMGVVYEAEDPSLGRPVALKVLQRELSERDRQRIQREALALARLSHPNVVHVYEIGREQGRTFVAMELVRGQTLDCWQQGRPPWRECVRVYLQAGRGLAAAHAVGLVHRDFKPSNCILGDDGRVRVLDFGLARAASAGSDEPVADGEGEGGDVELPLDARITQTGAVLGTLAYMPLEQLGGKPASEASDQFSFCVSIYEALYGERPFAGRSLGELMRSLMQGKIEPAPKGSLVPARVRRTVLRGLSAQPSQRWPSMDALLAELARQTRPRARRATVLLGVGGIAGLIAGALFFPQTGDEPCRKPEAALDGTWGPEDRARVASAFEGVADSEGTRALPKVRDELDRYANAWVDMYEESCKATFVGHQQSELMFDRRMQCLDRRRNRLRQTIDALATAETSVVLTQRMILPFKLPSLDGCADLEQLTAEQPLPDDEDQRARIERLREEIDDADTQYEAGEFKRGLEIAKTALAEARTLEYAPVLSEALASLGRLQASGASAREARATLEEAVLVASEARDDHATAAAWTWLLFAAALQSSVGDTTMLELAAQAAVVRADDDELRGWLLNNLGVLYTRKGDEDQALHYLRRALAAKQAVLGDEHVDVGITWYNIGAILLRFDADPNEALEALEQALRIYEATVGRGHPLALYASVDLCQVERIRGNAQKAVALCSEALERLEAFGIAPSTMSHASFMLARAQWDTGQHDVARQTAERARDLVATENQENASRIQRWLDDPEGFDRKQAAGEGVAADPPEPSAPTDDP